MIISEKNLAESHLNEISLSCNDAAESEIASLVEEIKPVKNTTNSKVNRLFNIKRGLVKMQKVVSGHPLLDEGNFESELANHI